MKTFSIRYKITAIAIALFFVFQSMSQINEHTYTTGVDSYHSFYSCFGGGIPSHLSVKCNTDSCY